MIFVLFFLDVLIILVPQKGDMMEIDPVCKMEVDPKTAQWKSEYKQNT